MTSTKKVKKWSVDLTLDESDAGYQSLMACPLGMKKVAAMEKQCQASSSSSSQASASASMSTELSPKEKQRAMAIVQKKGRMAMALATSPGRSIAMNAFMMYMSGKNLNIWTINTVGMAIMTPITAIFNIHKQFAKFEDSDGKVDLNMPKIIFTVLNLVWLCVGLWKMRSMRLLPTTSADWSGRIVWKEMEEITSIPPL